MLVFRYTRSSAPSALMSAVRIVLTVSLGIRSVGSIISTPHHTRQKGFPRAVTDMTTGRFPVDIYVKDVDASNAAPETDNLQLDSAVANRPQLCHYVGIAPLRLPPGI